MASVGRDLNSTIALVAEHDELADLDVAQRRLAMRALLLERGESSDSLERLAAFVDGYGALDPLMRDPLVTDILVNRFDEVWVDRQGTLVLTDVVFSGPLELDATIERLMARSGGRVDRARPIADVALPDGARMHVVVPPLSSHGPTVSIRKFSNTPLSLLDLRNLGMFDEVVHRRLLDAVQARETIAISGGTGSGKTTLLNALLSEISRSERLVTIEETPELRPRCAHRVALIARPPNIEGKGEVTLADLFRATLRMRPDRIVVGEVRGPEAAVALDAFSTGHPGSMVTVHARTASIALERFVALASGTGISEGTLIRRFRDAFDVVVQLSRTNGTRNVVEILEL